MNRSTDRGQPPYEFEDDERSRALDEATRSSAAETREKIRAIFAGHPKIPATLKKAPEPASVAPRGEAPMTHPLIEEWRRLREATKQAREAESRALEEAWDIPMPASVRPAVATDIVPGAIIWYPDSPGRLWFEVEEVRAPEDDFKGYLSEGCRYGLKGAYVERSS